MKRTLTALVLGLSLLVASGGVAYAQDFQKGVEAANKGDFATALREWRPLAEQGDAEAQADLGLMYMKGEGVTQDYKEAAKWLSKAAEQGNAKAQHTLGLTYDNGWGVTQDYKEAAKWYRKAAEGGITSAQYNLGNFYFKGNGVLQDNVYGHMWLNIAASNGHKSAAKNRDIVAKQMTPAQIAEAQKLARECVKKNYKGC